MVNKTLIDIFYEQKAIFYKQKSKFGEQFFVVYEKSFEL